MLSKIHAIATKVVNRYLLNTEAALIEDIDANLMRHQRQIERLSAKRGKAMLHGDSRKAEKSAQKISHLMNVKSELNRERTQLSMSQQRGCAALEYLAMVATIMALWLVYEWRTGHWNDVMRILS